MIAIIDYGMGNLRSVQKAIEHVGSAAEIVDQPEQIDRADQVILPGIGAFADAMTHLRDRGLVEAIRHSIASGKPFLGVCLGLQLLFDVSEEDGQYEGLGVMPGRVVRFQPQDRSLKIPHMGWNQLRFTQADCPLFRGLNHGDAVYFVHSYYAAPADDSVTAAQADYPTPFCAAVYRDNIYATQFHPEKSQTVGLTMLKNFVDL